jgi:putative endonuclease
VKYLNKTIGLIGERKAEEFLINLGYEVIQRNFSTRFGEIDLICRDNDTLVFVEVKTKTSLDYGSPEEMFTQTKRQKVVRMGYIYLQGNDVKCRIDMLAVVLMKPDYHVVSIRHYPNV